MLLTTLAERTLLSLLRVIARPTADEAVGATGHLYLGHVPLSFRRAPAEPKLSSGRKCSSHPQTNHFIGGNAPATALLPPGLTATPYNGPYRTAVE